MKGRARLIAILSLLEVSSNIQPKAVSEVMAVVRMAS